MKKIYFPLFFTLLSLGACKKDYSCECIVSQNISGFEQKSTTTTTIHDKKSKAKEECESMSISQNLGTLSQSASCSLK